MKESFMRDIRTKVTTTYDLASGMITKVEEEILPECTDERCTQAIIRESALLGYEVDKCYVPANEWGHIADYETYEVIDCEDVADNDNHEDYEDIEDYYD